jgi:formate hydrogenlyase subunit 6/NADH:ubiquinone oxidoreductase subunit I
MTRREFLKGLRSKDDGIPIIDKEKCTGCGLCTIDCPTKALTISQNGESDTYQILFRQETCNACGVCKKSCPENCLRLEQRHEPSKTDKKAKVIFEDKISRCIGCGIPLFPQAMVKNLKSKIFIARESNWPFDLCPSCRIKFQVAREIVRKK